MRIAGFSALVAGGDNIIGDPFAQPFIENKIFTDEFIFKPFFLHLLCIIDNATFQVKYIGKTRCAAYMRWLFRNEYRQCST